MDTDINEERLSGGLSSGRAESDIDAGPPTAPPPMLKSVSSNLARDIAAQELNARPLQLDETAGTFQTEGRPLDVERPAAAEAIDAGPAPAGPPEL